MSPQEISDRNIDQKKISSGTQGNKGPYKENFQGLAVAYIYRFAIGH